MNKSVFFVKMAFPMFAISLFSCSSDEDVNEKVNSVTPPTTQLMSFSAAMESGLPTRTTFADDKTTWADRDNIYVYNSAVSSTATLKNCGKFELKEGAGTASATFQGAQIATGTTNKFYAFYPAEVISDEQETVSYTLNSNHVVSGLNIPVHQTAVEGSYDQRLHYMTSCSTTTELEFNNVCALLKIGLSNNNKVKKIKVVANPIIGDNTPTFTYVNIAGQFSATVNDGGTSSVNITDGSTYVELTNSSNGVIDNGTYYLVVLPAAISNGFTVLLEGDDNIGIAQRVNSKMKSFAANDIYDLGTFDVASQTFIQNVVDLDLPSGTLWTTQNVGATSSTDPGKYFAWGEVYAQGETEANVALTIADFNNEDGSAPYWNRFVAVALKDNNYINAVNKGRQTYQWRDYKFGYLFRAFWGTAGVMTFDFFNDISQMNIDDAFISRYNTNSRFQRPNGAFIANQVAPDNRTRLMNVDDAAYMRMGANYCMPTNRQVKELLAKTTLSTTTEGNYLLTSSNSKSIILPCGGGYAYNVTPTVDNKNLNAQYWTKSLDTSKTGKEESLFANSLDIKNSVSTNTDERYKAKNIRAVVLNKQIYEPQQ